MEKMEQMSADCNPERMAHTLNDLKSYVERAAQQGVAAHEVEAEIWRRVLQLGHQALGRVCKLESYNHKRVAAISHMAQ